MVFNAFKSGIFLLSPTEGTGCKIWTPKYML